MTTGLYIVPPDRVAAVWPQVAPLLAKAVAKANGRASLQACHDECLSGEKQLWIAVQDGAVTLAACTSLQQFPGKKFLRIDQCGGSCLRAWLARAISAFKEWATRNGCSGLLIDGRRGWSRLLGARVVSVRMEIDL